MSISKLLWIVPACLVVIFCFYVVAFGRLAMNASDSLRGNAYAMVTWPLVLRPGSIVAVELPEIIRNRFEGGQLFLTKRVVGVAGDPVHRFGDKLCINHRCVHAHVKNGKPVADLWQGEVVPEGTIAVFGDSPDSLDSRYAVIGPLPVSSVVAAGMEIPFPHWTKLAEYLK